MDQPIDLGKKEIDCEKVYAICINGINDHAKEHQILAEIKTQTEIQILKVTKPFNKGFCFVKFENEEDQHQFEFKFQSGIKIKNRVGRIKPFQGNFKLFEEKEKDPIKQQSKKIKFAENVNTRSIRETICPYIDLPKEQQRKKKQENCIQHLTKAKKTILTKDCCKFLIRQTWLKNEDSVRQITKDVIFDESPVSRNKTEYTISRDFESNNIRIGFVVGRHPDGEFMTVDNDSSIPIISSTSFEIAEKMQKALNDLLSLSLDEEKKFFDAYNFKLREGCFRYLLIRESQTEKNYIVKLVCAISNPEQKSKIVCCIKDLCKSLPEGLKSFVIETYNGFSSCIPNDPANEETVFGTENFIFEKVMGVKFKIPFGAFFQVHTKLSELLYKQIESMLKIDEKTIFLDICAGTGTMGLILGQKAEKVIFVESEKASCDMIDLNLKLNQSEGLIQNFSDNFQIFNSRIENCIDKISEEFNGKGYRIVAVVDPPRAGLHVDVVKALRTFRGLDEFVFVSCDFRQGCENLTRFCCEESKTCRGPAFTPIAVQPIDLFPYTDHYETVVHLKRLYE